MNNQDQTSNCKGYITCSSLEELKKLTRFTPVNGKKPYIKQWQSNPKTISFCENEIKQGFADGYGLITGNGLLAIDFDGCNAHKIALAIGKWLVTIDTLAWSSGKPSRKQILVRIPEHRLNDFEKLSRKPLTSFGNVEAVKNEQLEIRYNRCQSVLPPSSHPETNGYHWLRETEIVQLNDYQCNCILSAIDTDNQSNTKQYQELGFRQDTCKLGHDVKKYNKISLFLYVYTIQPCIDMRKNPQLAMYIQKIAFYLSIELTFRAYNFFKFPLDFERKLNILGI